jgi:hypothetical protein
MNIRRSAMLCALVYALWIAIVTYADILFVVYPFVGGALRVVMAVPTLLALIYTADIAKYLLKGYAVYMPAGPEPPVFYKERGKGEIEFYLLAESDEDRRFYLVDIPSAQAWRSSVPNWAVDRRAKIVARVKKELRCDKSIRVPD